MSNEYIHVDVFVGITETAVNTLKRIGLTNEQIKDKLAKRHNHRLTYLDPNHIYQDNELVFVPYGQQVYLGLVVGEHMSKQSIETIMKDVNIDDIQFKSVLEKIAQ